MLFGCLFVKKPWSLLFLLFFLIYKNAYKSYSFIIAIEIPLLTLCCHYVWFEYEFHKIMNHKWLIKPLLYFIKINESQWMRLEWNDKEKSIYLGKWLNKDIKSLLRNLFWNFYSRPLIVFPLFMYPFQNKLNCAF